MLLAHHPGPTENTSRCQLQINETAYQPDVRIQCVLDKPFCGPIIMMSSP